MLDLKQTCKNECILKIAFLILITIIAEVVIWWAIIREDSVDWITSRIVHNPWPYAISELDDGRIIVGNVVKDFEITVPTGWEIERSKHPIFYIKDEESGEWVCEMRINIEVRKDGISLDDLLKEDGYKKISLGEFEATEISERGENFFTLVRFPLTDKNILTFDFKAYNSHQGRCAGDWESIKKSFVRYER